MEINFSKLQINDEQLQVMFNRVKEKDKVTELYLSNNDFTKLPDGIVEFINLEILYLTVCINLISLGELEEIGEDLSLVNCSNLRSLGKLKEVKGDLFLNKCSNLKDLGELKEVGGYLNLHNSGITEEYIHKYKPQLLDKCRW